jgi:putative redox protein
MKKTSQVIYKGNLRTTAVHLASNNEIITDAPTDNNGKGEAFSPTDLVATALASCMITIMGIIADKSGIDITGTSASITKVMASDPRRIAEVQVIITMPDQEYDSKDRKILEAAARTCPVALSLSADLVQTVDFVWK